MFDAELIRYLCGKLAAEQEPHKVEELTAALRAVIAADTDDIRLKLQYLLKHHPEVLADLYSKKAA